MEHQEATAASLPERYLLGELTAAEADAFEEHYFDCADCADDVRAGMQLMEGGRQLVRERAEPAAPAHVTSIAQHRRARWQWMPYAAAAVFAFALVGSLLMREGGAVTPRLAVATSTADLSGEARAGEDAAAVTLPAVITIAIPPDPPHERYRLRVVAPNGALLQELPLSREQASDYVSLIVDAGHTAGTYRVEIEGAGPAGQFRHIATRRFTVRG